MVFLSSSGSYSNTTQYLNSLKSESIFDILNEYGRKGVDALSAATPVDTGETAHSWEYEVEHSKGRHSISWYNTHEDNGVNIAIILQYGHGTGTGGYVEGIDYINPALRPLFDDLTQQILRRVVNAER